MKTNPEISELLEKMISGDISPMEKQELLELIERDDDVQQEYLLRQNIEKAIQNRDVMDLRKQLEAITHNRRDKSTLEEPLPLYRNWYVAAAILVVLTGITVILAQFLPDNQRYAGNSTSTIQKLTNQEVSNQDKTDQGNNEMVIADEGNKDVLSIEQSNNVHDSDRQNSANRVLANNYLESSYFESFIDNFRSETVIIISPQPNETYPIGAEVNFRWVQNVSDSVMIRIFNNKEENIYSVNAIQDFKLNLNLEPGLYYWKLETEKDLLFMNKFFIK